MTRVLLYSDEPILAKGLESVLRQVEGFDLLPTCTTVTSVMEQLSHGTPDLVLMDLTAEITFAVLSEMKHAMMSCKIVLWVNTISTELAFQAMGLGVRGILRKTLPTDVQVKCLQKVQTGELWFEKALTDSFLCARRVALTQREGQLVSLLSQGLKNKEIATSLMISEGTVKVYLSRLFQKVGVKDRFELALFGLKNLTTGRLPVGERLTTGILPESEPPTDPWVSHILTRSGLSLSFRTRCREAAEQALLTNAAAAGIEVKLLPRDVKVRQTHRQGVQNQTAYRPRDLAFEDRS